MFSLWETVIKLTGVLGLAALVIWSTHRHVLGKKIFPELKTDQALDLLKALLFYTFMGVVVIIIAFVVIQLAMPPGDKDAFSESHATKLEYAEKQLLNDEEFPKELKEKGQDVLRIGWQKYKAYSEGKFVLGNELDNQLDEQIEVFKSSRKDIMLTPKGEELLEEFTKTMTTAARYEEDAPKPPKGFDYPSIIEN